MLEEALHKYFPEKNLASGGLYLRQLYVVMSVLESEEGGCLKVMIAQGDPQAGLPNMQQLSPFMGRIGLGPRILQGCVITGFSTTL
jgi:hypothetical protein